MIRPATLSDKEAVIGLLREFFGQTEYSDLGWSQKSIEDIVERLITTDSAVILVSDGVTGLIGGYLTPYWMNMDKVFAQEMFWYVSKEHRGGSLGIRLLNAFQEWAKDGGADYCVMSSTTNLNPSGVGNVLKRSGFVPVDISYWKRLTNGN